MRSEDVADPAPPAIVHRAVRTLGLQPSSVVALPNPEPYVTWARAFVIHRDDGPTLKARIGRNAVEAARSLDLAGSLGDPRVPRAVARVGRVTFEQWVTGEPLSSVELRPEDIHDAADLLAAIHAFGGDPGERLPQIRRTDGMRRLRLGQLEPITQAGLISRAQMRQVRRVLTEMLPDREPWGLCHGDFTAANLVLSHDGRVISVDHERLHRGFFGFDVGRAWYRWWLSDADQRRFDGRYTLASGRSPDEAVRWTWRVITTAHGVFLRHVSGANTDRAVARLGEALAAI